MGTPHKPGVTVFANLYLLCVLSVLAPVSAAFAQTEEEFKALGFQKDREYFSPEAFEHFDPISGNLLITFTDLTLPGNAGRKLEFQRTYNNLRTGAYDRPSRWQFGFPGIVMRIMEFAAPPVGFDFDDQVAHLTAYSPKFQLTDGGLHPTIFSTRPDTSTTQSIAATTRMVISADFYKYDRVDHLLFMPDGTTCHYIPDGVDSITGRAWLALDWFEDAFGNRVTLTRDGSLLRVTQDLQNNQIRQVDLTVENSRVQSMSYNGRLWVYDYQGGTDIREVHIPLLEHPWVFTYGSTQTDYADLTRITLPSGGRIEYTWYTRVVNSGPPLVPFYLHYLSARDAFDRDDTPLGHWSFGAAGPSTLIHTPSVTVEYTAIGFTGPHLMDGAVAIGSRSVGSLETVASQYEIVPVVKYSPDVWFGTPEISQHTVTRGSRTYVTQYHYPTATDDFPFAHHRPTSIVENNNEGLGRTTTRTYTTAPTNAPIPTSSTAYILGLPATEDVTVGADTFRRKWFYNSAGFTTQYIDFAKLNATGIAINYTPDDVGNVRTVQRGATSTTYSYAWGATSQIQTGEYTITRQINDDGMIQSETRGTRTSTFGYDLLFRPTLVQPPGPTNPTITSYDNATGSSVTVSRGSSTLTTTLNGFGRATGTLNAAGVRTTTEYDAEGRITYRSLPFSGTANVGTRIEYDALDRVTREVVYDREHNVDGPYRQRTYGPDTISIRDEEGRVTEQRYVAFGHPDDARLTLVTDPKQQTWAYAYNVLGKLRNVTASDGVVRTWEYNDQNLLWHEIQPESGTTTYTYYPSGLVFTKADQKGALTTYYYDANDRLKSISVGTTTTTTIQYEPNSDQKQSISTPNGTTTFVYDDADRPQERRDAIAAYVFTSHYTYDANGNVVEITYPTQRAVHVDYDAENRVTHVFEPQIPRHYASGITYHPSGALASYTAGNGIQTTLTYDPLRYWVRGISAGTVQFTYDNYDNVGNVRSITDSRPGGMTQQITYDELNRIQTVSGPLPAAYAYDVHGNRTSANGATYTYEPEGTLRLKQRSGVAYSYDPNGNLQTAGPATFTYTPENWIASAIVPGGTTTYLYDSDGSRTRKTSPGGTTYYIRGLGGEVLTEWRLTEGTGHARDYIYAGDRLVSAVEHDWNPGATVCGGVAGPDGSPHSLTIAGGETASVSFEGSACRRVSARATVTSGSLGCPWTLGLKKPDGTTLPGGVASCSWNTVAFMEPVTLPVSGQYSGFVSAASNGSGAATLELFDVVDVTGSIALDGSPVTVPITVPGQQGRLTFTGATGSKVSARVSYSGWICSTFAIYKPDNTMLANQVGCGSGVFLDPVVLPADGVYTLVLDPWNDAVPTMTAQAWLVNDFNGAIDVGGPVVSMDLNTPGQRAFLTFPGVQGWRVSAVETMSAYICMTVIVHRPDMSVLSSEFLCGQGGLQEPVTLPTTGNYTLEIVPYQGATLTVTARLYLVVDYAGSISIGGDAVTVPLTSPGQVGRLTTNGTNGQQVTVHLTGNTAGWVWVTLQRPDLSTLIQDLVIWASLNMQTVTLPTTGPYTVLIDPSGTGTGSITVSVTSP